LVPFVKTENFIKKYNPSTTLHASYDYQSMPFIPGLSPLQALVMTGKPGLSGAYCQSGSVKPRKRTKY
jgi:hypothetical protein